MAEETVTPEAKGEQKPATPQSIPRSPTELGIDILAEHPDKEKPYEFGGLFSTESPRPSEAELGGEGPPKQEEKKAEPPPKETKEDPKKEPPKKDTAPPEPKGDEKKAEEKLPEEKKETAKPPEGFVPQQALKEARAPVDLAAAEASLRRSLARLKAVQKIRRKREVK